MRCVLARHILQNGKTALDIAIDGGQDEVADVLEADPRIRC